MKAGLCMVALNVRQTAAEHAYILNHSESRLLILDAEYCATWEQMQTTCPGMHGNHRGSCSNAVSCRYEDVIAAASSAAPEVLVSLDDLERIAYTSGTTGRPKGIMKTIGNDLAQLRNDFLNEDQMTTADDVMLNMAPLTRCRSRSEALHEGPVTSSSGILAKRQSSPPLRRSM